MSLIQSAEAIGQAIAARIAGVTIALGAETNLGVAVYRGRRSIDDDMVPCAALIEGSDRVEEPDGRTDTGARITQAYVLLAYVPCAVDNPNDAAHAALRDMKRALFKTDGKPDRSLGGTVKRVRYRGRDIGPRGDGAAFVVAALEIEIDYVEDLANP